MKEVVFTIRHDVGCWSTTTENTELEFKETQALAKILPNGKTLTWQQYLVYDPKKELEEWLARMKTKRDLKTIQVTPVSKRKNSYLVYLEWVGPTVFSEITKYGFQLSPITVKEGYEFWHVGVSDSRGLADILDDIKALGEVKVKRIGHVEPNNWKDLLTPTQERVLRLAIDLGYYSWPRKVTLEELAAAIGVSRRSVQEALRRAETKIMNKWVKEALNTI